MLVFQILIAPAFCYPGGRQAEEERSQKIDDYPILVTCRSGTLVILSSEVNDLAAHGSTQ